MKIRYSLVAGAAILALAGCSEPRTSAPRSSAPTPPPSATPSHTAGATYDLDEYAGPAQKVTGHQYEPAVIATTKAKRECARYKTVAGKRKCAEYRTTPASTTVTDDADWYLVLADGTRIDVDEATQARYPAGVTFP